MSFFRRDLISTLRRSIEMMVYHRRQQLVIEILWDECRSKFYEDNVHTRQLMLIGLIDKMAQRECPAARAYAPKELA